MKEVGKFYGHSVYFMYCHFVYFIAIWYILWSFWYIFTFLVCCTKKHLATLVQCFDSHCLTGGTGKSAARSAVAITFQFLRQNGKVTKFEQKN
jgi:hypothetical protein